MQMNAFEALMIARKKSGIAPHEEALAEIMRRIKLAAEDGKQDISVYASDYKMDKETMRLLVTALEDKGFSSYVGPDLLDFPFLTRELIRARGACLSVSWAGAETRKTCQG